MERKRAAIFLRQLVDGLRNFRQSVGIFRGFGGFNLRQIHLIEVIAFVDHRLRTNHPTIIVDKDIAHNGKDPTTEI